ncbi:aminoglycoside adenylyltransferase domain-containing protein [Saccharomonospora sp. CUA-673]|uniref:aminoglycoside adenylyltransferase domain-containing protein n=1 Tax=Saccharomonospora sp. CUA-673 TaxID=1904969 RepID=UPI001C9E4C5C|nr:aminoglycoside adenylyltransferase domain-containing protein [Saccharomonospora sp. CUA-673]
MAERSLTGEQRRALTDGCLRLSGMSGDVRPVELTVVVREDVVPWRFPPTGDFLYGEWLRSEFEAGTVPERGPMPDLAVVIATALQSDRTLAGAPPATVLEPVPTSDVVRASVESLDELLSEVGTDTRNVVLTAARVWSTAVTGTIMTKDEAAAWAARRLPDEYAPVVEHARDLYLGTTYADETWPEPIRARAHDCVERMATEARAAHERRDDESD